MTAAASTAVDLEATRCWSAPKGLPGSVKSTQARLLVDRLRHDGYRYKTPCEVYDEFLNRQQTA